ncbi:MAG TPA: response regulator transcription factor [Micromonosporaceae bacterium]|nr:response regulator transcription factor [Micromonosporaceae bacterium]
MDEFDGLERLTDARRLLIVEDDRELRTMLERLLGDEGYQVDAVADGQAGLHRALIDRYDVMVIDRGLPAIDGLDLTRRLRGRGVGTPVIMLTAYGSVVDRVEGLDAGAEDYLVKPFEVDELLARLRALLRRHATIGETIQIGDGTVDLVTRIARTSDGRAIELSGRECALLRTLASRPGRVFSRDELRKTVFDTADSETVVDTYVHYLRRKLGKGVVHTMRGHGYRIGAM